jgi:hypothetical protein
MSNTTGSDLKLIQLVKKSFETAGWRTHVDTGRLTFPVGTKSHNIADGNNDHQIAQTDQSTSDEL